MTRIADMPIVSHKIDVPTGNCTTCGASAYEMATHDINPLICPGPCTELRLLWQDTTHECWQSPQAGKYLRDKRRPVDPAFEAWKAHRVQTAGLVGFPATASMTRQTFRLPTCWDELFAETEQVPFQPTGDLNEDVIVEAISQIRSGAIPTITPNLFVPKAR